MGKLKGQAEYEKFKKGLPLTMKQSIKAQCFMCNGEKEGSWEDCFGKSCPLYPYFKKWIKKRSTSGDKSQVQSSESEKGGLI